MDPLWCPACDRRHPPAPEEPWQCPEGHPLEYPDQSAPPGDPPTLTAADRRRGVWSFERMLPTGPKPTLGEGWTPLIDDESAGVSYKLEYVSPTRSFKDRGAAVTIARAIGLDVDRVLEDSSGNAGAAIATYAARAGIPARIYVPASSSPKKQARIERTGAEVVVVDGPRAVATKACQSAVEAGEGWYASHAYQPAFYAGTATFAYELAAQLGWSAPENVVLPVGHGTLFLGAARGFERLASAGWIESVPRLLAVQARGMAPLVEAVHDAASADGSNTLADGVQIEAPARFDELRSAVDRFDGDAVAVGEARTERTLDRLQRSGFPVEPTAALAPAGLELYRERGIVDAGEDVVVPLTGAGTVP